MKKYLLILVCMFTMLLSSCVTSASVQDDTYVTYVDTHESYTTIVTYGTPYYYNGVISYYYYKGYYYYPYFWENCWYLHPFRHLQYVGYVYYPPRYHRPVHHLGDIHNKHVHNYGNYWVGHRPHRPQVHPDRPHHPSRPNTPSTRPGNNRPQGPRPQVNRPQPRNSNPVRGNIHSGRR